MENHTSEEKSLASVNAGYIVSKQWQPLLSEMDKLKMKVGGHQSAPLFSKAQAISVRFML